MFGFIKNYFFTAMIFGCNVWNVIPLKYVSMSNQECKVRPEIINLTVMNLHYILTEFLKINEVAVVITIIIHKQNNVFLMLLKI